MGGLLHLLKRPALETGIKQLDNLLKGIQAKEVVLVIAENKSYQEEFLLNLVYSNLFESRETIALFVQKMKAKTFSEKLLAFDTGVDYEAIKDNNFTVRDFPVVSEAVKKLSKRDLFIDESNGVFPMEVREKCIKLLRKQDVSMMIIDDLFRMMPPDISVPREDQIVMCLERLKETTEKLEIPTIVFCRSEDIFEQFNELSLGSFPKMMEPIATKIITLQQANSFFQCVDIFVCKNNIGGTGHVVMEKRLFAEEEERVAMPF